MQRSRWKSRYDAVRFAAVVRIHMKRERESAVKIRPIDEHETSHISNIIAPEYQVTRRVRQRMKNVIKIMMMIQASDDMCRALIFIERVPSGISFFFSVGPHSHSHLLHGR